MLDIVLCVIACIGFALTLVGCSMDRNELVLSGSIIAAVVIMVTLLNMLPQ